MLVKMADATDPLTAPDGGNAWMVAGQVVFVETAGYFQVLNPVGTTQALLINLRTTAGAYQSNAISGPLVVGSAIVPAGIQGPAGLSISVTSGSLAPSVDLGQEPGLYLRTGGNYYIWDIGGQSWTDTGISVTGPAGATGATGAAGHSPAVTTVTSNPTGAGGAAGDIRLYQPLTNSGITTFYYNLAGTWTQGPTVLSSRLLGYSVGPSSPNPGGLACNLGDYYWVYDSPNLIIYVCNLAAPTGGVGGWAVALTIPVGGGGGGVGTFQQVSDASPVVGSGRGTGTNIWVMEASIQNKVLEFSTSTYAVTFDTKFQRQKCNITLADVTLNWSAINSTQDCEWVFEMYNGYSSQTTIAYAAGRWTKNPGISHPVILNPGETVIIHCRSTKGFLNIVCVQQNQTIIS